MPNHAIHTCSIIVVHRTGKECFPSTGVPLIDCKRGTLVSPFNSSVNAAPILMELNLVIVTLGTIRPDDSGVAFEQKTLDVFGRLGMPESKSP